MKGLTGAELIAYERKRQIEQEGWSPLHDEQHVKGELVAAGVCYADVAFKQETSDPAEAALMTHRRWPWSPSWWKPAVDPVRNLVKAGALFAAAIDRILAARERRQERRVEEAEERKELRGQF